METLETSNGQTIISNSDKPLSGLIKILTNSESKERLKDANSSASVSSRALANKLAKDNNLLVIPDNADSLNALETKGILCSGNIAEIGNSQNASYGYLVEIDGARYVVKSEMANPPSVGDEGKEITLSFRARYIGTDFSHWMTITEIAD